MGNLSSHETVETLREYRDPYNFESYDEWISPIENDEQFLEKWHRLIIRRLELADNDPFRQVFETVCKQTGEKGYWSQKTFISFFLDTTKPFLTTPQDAQLLYDMILRLGSYPYVTLPTLGRTLDFLTFKIGLMVLTGRLTSTPSIASGFKFAGEAGRKHRRVLFLALLDDFAAPTSRRRMERTEEDDEDLIDVLRLFEAYRWEGPNPCMMYEGPVIPHWTAFRSSRSVPRGVVDTEKLRRLLRLLLLVKLSQFGIDINSPAVRELGRTGVIDSILASSGESSTATSGCISWAEFDRLFATVPRAFESLSLLFKAFIFPNPGTALEPDAYIQKQNSWVSYSLSNLPGSILTLPLLSQILCSTWSDTIYTSHALNPNDLATHNLEYSGPISTFATALSQLSESTRTRKQALILISGTTVTTEPLIGGIYLNNNLDEFTTSFLFEVKPFNHSFAANRDPGESHCAQSTEIAMTNDGPTMKTTVSGREGTGRHASMSLELREGGLGEFSWEWGLESTGKQEFRIDLIEYISFGREK